MRKRVPQPVELLDHQRVASPQGRQRGFEAGTLGDTAADALVDQKLLAFDSLQRVTLEGEILIGRRGRGVANKHREFSNGFSEPTSVRFDWYFFLVENRTVAEQALSQRALAGARPHTVSASDSFVRIEDDLLKNTSAVRGFMKIPDLSEPSCHFKASWR